MVPVYIVGRLDYGKRCKSLMTKSRMIETGMDKTFRGPYLGIITPLKLRKVMI